VILAVFLAPMAAAMIQMLISRTREYSADRMGAEIARDPIGLADALRKISSAAKRIEMPSAERNPASAHLFIVNPLSGARMDNLFSTHPARRTASRRSRRWRRDARPQPTRELDAAGRPAGAVRPRRVDRRTEPRPAGPPGLAARRAAAELVEGVLERGRSLADQAGPEGPLARLAPVDRARAGSLADAVLRHLGALDGVLDGFLRRRPAGRARTALRLVAAELLVEGVAAHAAVDAAVTLTRSHPKSRHLAPLVNAVARRVAGEGPALWQAAAPPALPAWIAVPVAGAWGEDAASASPPPMPCGRRSTSRCAILPGPGNGGSGSGRRCCRRGACGWRVGCRSRRCPASTRGRGGCRMPPPRCRRGCSACGRGSGCSISARRRAARRCSSRPRGRG
jgi:hypothetical protein